MSTKKKRKQPANARKIICASKQNKKKLHYVPTLTSENLEPFDFVQRNVSP